MGQHRLLPLYRKLMARKMIWISGVEHRTESSTGALIPLKLRTRSYSFAETES